MCKALGKTHLNVFKVAEDHNLGIYPIKNFFFNLIDKTCFQSGVF